ncbi:MAG: Gfo/Idh/MocA family oxidoreductase [Bacteroidota bacterium]
MLKIGVIGAGHLGKIHIRQIKELGDQFQLIGFFDTDTANAERVAEEFQIQQFNTIDELLKEVDCVDIVTPTFAHFECAKQAIKAGKHLFIEKPITENSEEAKILMALSAEAGVKVQVGHVERFNPAFQQALPYLNTPMFIETHRLAQFNPRGTDVSVVMDLMIHDLDIILHVVKSEIKSIAASGVPVISDTPDITNARLEFMNGCTVNLTASRISMKNMRKSRFFQKDAYISVDFLSKEMEVVRMEEVEGEPDPFDIVIDPGNGKTPRKIYFDKPEISEINAIREELRTFAVCIEEDTEPIVTISDGCKALLLAEQIISKIKSPI